MASHKKKFNQWRGRCGERQINPFLMSRGHNPIQPSLLGKVCQQIISSECPLVTMLSTSILTRALSLAKAFPDSWACSSVVEDFPVRTNLALHGDKERNSQILSFPHQVLEGNWNHSVCDHLCLASSTENSVSQPP